MIFQIDFLIYPILQNLGIFMHLEVGIATAKNTEELQLSQKAVTAYLSIKQLLLLALQGSTWELRGSKGHNSQLV